MADESFRIAELLLDGYTCGQILVKLALEAQGRDNPDLVRAMSGLALGMGQGFNCGSLTGGCCVLGLYGGRSDENQPGHPRFDIMVEEFSGWFESEMTEKYRRDRLRKDHPFRPGPEAGALPWHHPRLLAEGQGDPRQAQGGHDAAGANRLGGRLDHGAPRQSRSRGGHGRDCAGCRLLVAHGRLQAAAGLRRADRYWPCGGGPARGRGAAYPCGDGLPGGAAGAGTGGNWSYAKSG